MANKIGYSYSRCVLDILNGVVNYDHVLVIIARTKFNPNIKKHWDEIYKGYTSYNAWSDQPWGYSKYTEKDFKDLTMHLWRDGKLHQPRLFGSSPPRSSVIWGNVND